MQERITSAEAATLRSALKRKNKYRNIRVDVMGITFDSKKEARRYTDLRMLLKGKAITELVIHPIYRMMVNSQHICDYEADFAYVEKEKQIVEDVKSGITKTRAYRIKVKLLKALYPDVIFREV